MGRREWDSRRKSSKFPDPLVGIFLPHGASALPDVLACPTPKVALPNPVDTLHFPGSTLAHCITALLPIAGVFSPASRPKQKWFPRSLSHEQTPSFPVVNNVLHTAHPTAFQWLGSVWRFIHDCKSRVRSTFGRGFLFDSTRTCTVAAICYLSPNTSRRSMPHPSHLAIPTLDNAMYYPEKQSHFCYLQT